MIQQQRVKYHRLGLVLWGLVFLQATQSGFGTGQAPGVGMLHLEGQGIERLVLQDDTRQPKVFQRPEPSLVLSEGCYHVEQITLLGGHSCHQYQVPYAQRIVRIGPGAPATLKLGAPLRQVVQIERRGASMVLNYQLVGQGGELYAVSRNRAPSDRRLRYTKANGRSHVRAIEYGEAALLVLVAGTLDRRRSTANHPQLQSRCLGSRRRRAGPL
jgi:hypothetical protein